MLPRSAENRTQCIPRRPRDLTMQAQSTLRAKPLRHPPLDLFLINQFAAISGVESLLDRLLNIDVVLNVFQRYFIG